MDTEQLEKYEFGIACIAKDINRSDPGNNDWKIPSSSGKNALFNVLCAYYNYDPEIGYS